MAVKPAEVPPAATVTDAGTVRFVLLEESATAAPPEGAAALRDTVQDNVPAGALDGQLRAET